MSRRRRNKARPSELIVSGAPAGQLTRTTEPAPSGQRPVVEDRLTEGSAGRPDWWPTAAVVVITVGALLLYLRTLAPGLSTGDSGDLISAAWVLGVAHPPGYPLYTMLAHLAAVGVPFGEPAWRINVFSAACAAIAVGLVGLACYRLLPPGAGRVARLTAVVVGGGALAVSTVFWAYSIVSEVFALNALFAALILLLAIAWAEQPRRFRLLWALGLVGGLSLAHHHTIILLGPAVLVLLVAGLARLGVLPRWARATGQDRASTRRQRMAARAAAGATRATPAPPLSMIVRQFAIAAGLLLVGLLPYLYLPLAASGAPPINWGDPVTLDRLVEIVTRTHYGSLSLTAQDRLGSPIEHVAIFLRYLWQAFGPLGCALAVLGVVRLRHRPAVALALVAGVFFAGPVFVAYANPAITSPLILGILERFSILPSVPMAMLVGAGAGALVEGGAWLVGRIGASGGAVGRRAWSAVPAAIALALVLVLLGTAAVRLGEVDQSGNRLAETYSEDLLELLAPNAILLMRGDENYTAIAWAQHVAGIRPDVTALDIELLKLETTVQQARAADPDLIIPFSRYDEGGRASIRELVAANVERRPIYIVGALRDSDPLTGYVYKRYGLVRQIVPAAGSTADEYSLVIADADRITSRLRFPEVRSPETTWESVIDGTYGRAAFDLGYVAQTRGREEDAATWYRRTLTLEPEHASAYKNLGLLLHQQGGHRDEVVALWTEYLRLNPEDPQAPAIREELARLSATP